MGKKMACVGLQSVPCVNNRPAINLSLIHILDTRAKFYENRLMLYKVIVTHTSKDRETLKKSF